MKLDIAANWILHVDASILGKYIFSQKRLERNECEGCFKREKSEEQQEVFQLWYEGPDDPAPDAWKTLKSTTSTLHRWEIWNGQPVEK